MKSRILSVFALAILLASCSSAYRQAQTPDDVYYSPAKEKEKVYASANDKSQSDNYAHHNNSNYLTIITHPVSFTPISFMSMM